MWPASSDTHMMPPSLVSTIVESLDRQVATLVASAQSTNVSFEGDAWSHPRSGMPLCTISTRGTSNRNASMCVTSRHAASKHTPSSHYISRYLRFHHQPIRFSSMLQSNTYKLTPWRPPPNRPTPYKPPPSMPPITLHHPLAIHIV